MSIFIVMRNYTFFRRVSGGCNMYLRVNTSLTFSALGISAYHHKDVYNILYSFISINQ